MAKPLYDTDFHAWEQQARTVWEKEWATR